MSRAIANRPPADRRKLILWVTLAVVVIAVIVAVALASRQVVPNAASNAPMQANLKVGDTAPEFSVQTTAGPFDLNSIPTPVVLEAFATWCPHCQRETQVMNSLAQRFAGKIAFVAVSASPYGIDGQSPETQTDVNQFGATFHVVYPLAFDPTLKVGQEYLRGGYPTIAVIDKNKKIRYYQDGERSEAELAKAIQSVL